MRNLLGFNFVIFIFLALCSINALALASAGDLDTSFGNNGIMTTDFFGQTDFVRSMNIDSDGTILLSGGASKERHSDLFAMVRYDQDGNLDGSFGDQGKVATANIASAGNLYGGIDGSAITSDGKIVASGRYGGGLILVRYNYDGSIDESFGDNGGTKVPDASRLITPLALTIDESDKIIIVASLRVPGQLESSFGIFRFYVDGSLDEGFGERGIVTTTVTGGNDVPRAVKVDPYGRIVVGGFSGYGKFVVARYFYDGSRDPSFGDNGIATILFNKHGTDTLNALAIQQDGKIVVGGSVQVGNIGGLRTIDFGLARLNYDGQLDLTFNETGTQITHFISPAASSLWALAIQADGKIVAAGDSMRAKGLAVARYNVDGSLDESFGVDGKKTISFGRTGYFEAMGIQPDKKIVAAGYVWNGKHYDMTAVRLLD